MVAESQLSPPRREIATLFSGKQHSNPSSVVCSVPRPSYLLSTYFNPCKIKWPGMTALDGQRPPGRHPVARWARFKSSEWLKRRNEEKM